MRFGIVLSEVLSGMRRNASMVVSVILVTFISLTFVGTAALLQLQIGQMKTYWYDRAQVAVYMCTQFDCDGGEATADQIAAVKAQLESTTLQPFIDKVDFEDHQEAYTHFEQQFKGNAIADSATPAQLNQTFWVRLDNPSQSDVVSEAVGSMAGVQSVTDQRSILDRIFSVLNAASYTAIGIAVLMLIAAMLLISTTIRLSVFSRRREIGIMRLVGASNRFIQIPFVLEGVVAAVVGAVLASAATVSVVQFFVQGYLAAKAPFTSYVTVADSWIVVPILLLAGIVVAVISSRFAIMRYLRV